MGQQFSRSLLATEQETQTTGPNERNSLIAQESDASEEFDTQPGKRRRIMDEQSMVVHDEEQGSSSNSQLTCHLDWLPNNSSVHSKIMILKRKLDRLCARQHDVLTELGHAEFQPGQKRRAVVHHWLTEVERLKDSIRSMIRDGQGTSPNSNISGSIESLIKEVDELIERSEFSTGLVLLDQERTRLPLSLDIKPVGTNFQQNVKKIMGWLQNHEHCIIGLYGMGGVGKTTLLKHIHDQLVKDSDLCGHAYWVTVSHNCSVHKLQGDIAKVLGLASFPEHDEGKRAAVLHNRLAARGRTVLILDDMWKQFSRSEVGIPLENSSCKIILSTRSCDVCRKMGCKDFVIKAEILHKKEAWDLFVEKLGHYDTLAKEAKKIAWDIAKECHGLPLALVTVGRCMTGITELCEWENALEELRKPASRQDEFEDEVIRILKFSYDRLKDDKVQNCFLSCVLFPEDKVISEVVLVDLWINEGLLDDMDNQQGRVNKGHVILNRLVNACLLERSCDGRGVKVHDLIRDMGIIITSKYPLFIAEAGKQLKQLPEQKKWSKDLVKVSFSDNEIEKISSATAPMTPNLTVLMLNRNPLEEMPDSFFLHMRTLTVLDLSQTAIERVPESVTDLVNLRGFLLRNCEFLIYVPSVAKFTKLRMLDLYGCDKLERAPEGLERLERVEKLSYTPWDASDMIRFNKFIQSSTSLSSFRIWIRDLTVDDLPLHSGNFYNSDKVIWVSCGQHGGNNSIIKVPATLEHLDISKSEMKGTCLGDVIQPVGEITGLESIHIQDCRGLEYIAGSSGTQQGSSLLCNVQLESTVLKELPDLRSIAKLGVPDCFTQLRVLDIWDCPKLKVVFPVPLTKKLLFPNLERIRVYNCEEVKEIFETVEATLTNHVLSLPKLKRFCLQDLPKIKVIFPLTVVFDLPNLEIISVEGCKELEEIFGSKKQASPSSNPILSLPKLCRLNLLALPEVNSIYRGIVRCTSMLDIGIPIRICPKLKCWRLPKGGLTSDESWSVMESHHITSTTASLSINQPASPHSNTV